jgi:RimJ/RimL family protein N-acetyltransferase
MVMQSLSGLRIDPVDRSGFDAFFAYLNDHISDNGAVIYFQPLSRSDAGVPPRIEASFREGLDIAPCYPGWRRAWAARSADRQIIGHIDLRSRQDRFAEHRCLMGMGVDRDHRKRGIGRALITYAEDWARANTALEWIDLQVLSENTPAMQLYARMGFELVGEIPDMFRIDGRSFSYTTMARKIAR